MDMVSTFGDLPFSWLLDNFTLVLGGCLIVLLVKLSGNFIYLRELFTKVEALKDGTQNKEIRDKKLNEIRSKYGLTCNGCLPEFCLEKLPIYYREWEDVVQKLPDLNRQGKLKGAIMKMKLLSCEHLQTVAMLRRAYILIGMLVHSYVNGENSAWDKLKEETGIVAVERDVHVTENHCDQRGIEVMTEKVEKERRKSEKGECNDYSQNGKNDKTTILANDISNEIKNKNDVCSIVYGEICNNKGKDVDKENIFVNDTAVDLYHNIPCVPCQLAIPWFLICNRLDLPLVLTAYLDLWNWKLKDERKAHDLSNLASLMTVTGTKAEMYFHLVPCQMHYVAAPLIPQIFVLYSEIAFDAQGNKFADVSQTKCTNSKVFSFLLELTNVYKAFKNILKKMTDLVDIDTFYHVYRPFLPGFWPNGVLFELAHGDEITEDNLLISSLLSGEQENMGTVEEDSQERNRVKDNIDGKMGVTMVDEKQAMAKVGIMSAAVDSVITKRIPNKGIIASPKGPSAGQSAMILLFDLLLGIKHKGSGKEFQDEVANYMSPGHRQMIYDLRDLVKKYGTLQDFIIGSENQSQYQDLVSAFNECIKAVANFRALHLGIAVRYLESTKKGTGASPFRDMLSSMVSSTKQTMIHT